MPQSRLKMSDLVEIADLAVLLVNELTCDRLVGAQYEAKEALVKALRDNGFMAPAPAIPHCPHCDATIKIRKRKMHESEGVDECQNGHIFPSSASINK